MPIAREALHKLFDVIGESPDSLAELIESFLEKLPCFLTGYTGQPLQPIAGGIEAGQWGKMNREAVETATEKHGSKGARGLL